MLKDLYLKDITYQEVLTKIIVSSSTKKPIEPIFYQPIDSDTKRYEKIRKLTTGHGEDYITGCFLDYEYTRNHYRLIAVYLSRHKKQMLI